MTEDRKDLELGSAPILILCAGVGLALVALANGLSRATLEPTQLIYWLGVVVIAVPIFYRLCSKEAGFRERLFLVVLLGLSLYAVKLIRDAPFFTFPDELVHGFNATQIVEHHRLFEANTLIPVTPRYPGLEGATSALMTLTGLSAYSAGAVIIGAARIVFMAALFFVFDRLSGSARTAGIGVAVYTGTSNFLFWNAQYSYESLALPLMVLVLMMVLEREHSPRGSRASWAIPILLCIPAIIVTHHLTSYALIGILVALSLLQLLLKSKRPNPWPFAVYATVLCALWLLVVAESTIQYLFPVIREAVEATLQTASGEAPPRTLFHSTDSALGTTPTGARLVALAAVVMLAVGLALGLRHSWRRRRELEPMAILLILAAIAFFGTLALKFAPAAWETGNRAGEFLFLGLAFVVALGLMTLLRPGRKARGRRIAVAAGLGVILTGGAIAGWPWDVQLARPLQVSAEGRTIESPGLTLARWASTHLPNRKVTAPDADSRLLSEPGGLPTYAPRTGVDFEDVVSNPELAEFQIPLLEEFGIHYVVIDRRVLANNSLRGYFFGVPGSSQEESLPRGVVTKFSTLPVARLYNSGQISVFDILAEP